MPTIPQARFSELLRDIEPSPTTKRNASSAHEELRSFLKNDQDFEDFHLNDFLSGSYKRDTAIRPRQKGEQVDRPDVDIIVVTNHSSTDAPADVVDLLFDTLKKRYPNIRRQSRSVGIQYYKADMDVVAIIPDGQMYLIPDRKQVCWIPTNPPGHTAWTITTNTKAGGRFKPLVKLMKWWRRENPTVSNKPKGFVIECITAECMDYQETYYGELFVKTLETIVTRYRTHALLRTVPRIPDPGVSANSVTDGITPEAFLGFYNKAKNHAEIGRRALDETDPEEATKLWRKLFGDRFPKTESSSPESLLAQAVMPGTATFPDKPITPNKPKGFA